jgi:predicted HicB family RNase H-like nuclease
VKAQPSFVILRKKKWKPKVNLTVSAKVKKAASAWCDQNQCSLSALVEELLKRHLKSAKGGAL